MKVQQFVWNTKNWESKESPASFLKDPQLVLYFGNREIIDSQDPFAALKALYPFAHILGCSTGGEIFNDTVYDESAVAVAIRFESTTIKAVKTKINNNDDSFKAGCFLGDGLNDSNLKGIFVISEGLNINGTELVRGISDKVGKGITISGGLAGDGANFACTLVGLDEQPLAHCVAAIGFYGDKISIKTGSMGGWTPFGPERTITKSEGNVLYEIDGKPALDIYKRYLGDESRNLPGSALLFPLSIRPTDDKKHTIVRTILSVNEQNHSMTFAGNIPQGNICQFMHGSFDKLIEGALTAAEQTNLKEDEGGLAILISCIGRKLLLGEYIGGEVEAVLSTWNNKIPGIGFYSYGEIAPQFSSGMSSLHNQTMTIMTLSEA